MILSKRILYSITIFFVLLWCLYGFNMAYRGTIIIGGNIYFINNVVFAYIKLKNVHFKFSKAATKKEWIHFIISSIIIWLLFVSLYSYTYSFWIAITIPIVVLTILLIYDLLVSYIKRI